MNFRPDFLIKPYIVHSDPKLRPSDGDVFATVYWFEKMALGECTASNETIAEIAGITPRAVQASLNRLEKQKYTARDYNPDGTRKRIRCLVGFAKQENGEKPTEEKTKTQYELATLFFKDEEKQKQIVIAVTEKTKIPESMVSLEVAKFIKYWTEETKNGKPLWKTKPAFQLNNRLATWMNNAVKYRKSTSQTLVV